MNFGNRGVKKSSKYLLVAVALRTFHNVNLFMVFLVYIHFHNELIKSIILLRNLPQQSLYSSKNLLENNAISDYTLQRRLYMHWVSQRIIVVHFTVVSTSTYADGFL